MAVGYTSYFADKVMNACLNNTSFAVTTVYVQLHTADPGAAGATAVASNSTRQPASFATVSGAVAASDAAVIWSSVPTTEVYTHFSLWDASTSGNCLWTGTVATGSVSAGNNFDLGSGDIDLTMTVAS